MNLLVGSTGFIGSHVVEYLFQQNEISKGIFRKGARLKTMDLNGVQGVEADILDHHSLHQAMDGVDTIYSLASPPPSAADFSANTLGIGNLVEVARESGVKTLVHLSTLDVFGFGSPSVSAETPPRPSGAYQKSKLEADTKLIGFSKRGEDPRVVIVRAARAVGSRDATLVVPLLRMIRSGEVAVPRSARMSFTHPKDIAAAMFLAATNAAPNGSVYLLKSFDAAAEELVLGLGRALGVSPKVRGQGILSRGNLPSYTLDQLRASLRIGDQSSWTEIGYSPQYSLDGACSEVAQWYRKEPWAVEES